jgi:hypothetical protein
MNPQNLSAGMARCDQEIIDPGDGAAIPTTRNGIVTIISGASGETNTLARPDHVGQEIGFLMKTHGGGDRVITVTGTINQAGNNVITLGAIQDFILLRAVQRAAGLSWQVVANDGAALS